MSASCKRNLWHFSVKSEMPFFMKGGLPMKREVKKVLACCLVLAMCLCNLSVTTITSQAATKKATAITLNAKKKALTVGQKYQLKVKKVKPSKASKSVTWKSSNSKVAKVSSKGKVTAKKAGKATITAISKTNKKVKATCKITVYSKPTKVSLNYGSREIKTGESFNLKATVSPKKAKQTVTYSSSNKKVATVNRSGKVTGKTAGKATITVVSTTNKSKKAKCVVYVSGGTEATATPTATTAPTITDSAAVTGVPTATPNPLIKTGITRAEWVTALLQAMDCQVEESNLEKDENGTVVYHFSDIESSEYATEIETAAIFGYIESGNGTEIFQPEQGVTREYAVMTAVNALGVGETEEIVCDDSEDITYKTQANYAVAENMVSLENGKFNPDRILNQEEQTQLLNRLAQIRQERSAEAIITPVIEYTENVVVPEAESEEGYTVTTLSEEVYQVKISESSLTGYGISKEKLFDGEILVLPSTAEAPSGMTLAIEGVEEISGVYTITGAVPSDISQVYERIQVSGTADASTQTIEPEYGVTIEEVNGEKEIVISEEAINASFSGSLDLYSEEKSFKPNDYVSGKITFKIPEVSYYADIDFPFGKPKVNQVSLTIKENLKVETTIKGSISGSIPVGETTIPIKQIPGLAIKAKITLEYSASGNVEFVFNVDAQQTIGVKDGTLFKETPKPSITETLTIEAEGTIGPKLVVSLVWPSAAKEPAVIFDASTDFGIGIKGSSTTHAGNGAVSYFHCVDGKIYFYLNASLITEDCILYDLCHKNWNIFTESNSPLRWHGHWENGTKVDSCTWSENMTPTPAPGESGGNTPTITTVPLITIAPGENGGSTGSGGNYAGLSGPRTDAEGNVTYDCVYFGSYPQSDATGQTKEPIKWRILSINGTEAFLVADQNLDVYPYNEEWTDVTWETSTIRSWLNGYGSGANAYGKDYSSDNFINKAFTTAEQAAIPYVTVVNEDNPDYGTEGGNNTLDKIYLLSIAEVSNTAYGFLPYKDENTNYIEDNARLRTNTAYVAAGGAIGSSYMSSEGSSDWWWLRSPGYYGTDASYVNYDGYVNRGGDIVYGSSSAVCPALHLNLSSTNVWSNAGTVTIER